MPTNRSTTEIASSPREFYEKEVLPFLIDDEAKQYEDLPKEDQEEVERLFKEYLIENGVSS